MSESINIDDFLNKYSVNSYKNKETSADENNKFLEKLDLVRNKKPEGFYKIDNYYNFYGVMAPRVEVYFRDGANWKNISDVLGKKNFNNNFFVSATIDDNGARKISLTLFDKSFYYLQYLLFNAIKSSSNTSKPDAEGKTQTVNVKNEKGEVATELAFKISKDEIVNNLKVVWGYTDANPSMSKTIDLTNSNYFKFSGGESTDSTNRWVDASTTGGAISNQNGKTVGRTGYDTTLNSFNQTTIRSQEEEFFITDVKTTLTNTGMRYDINGVGVDSFILNSFKFVQMYASLRGTAKDLMAYFMKTFNEDTENSLLKVCWNDSVNLLNSGEYIKDYFTGNYVKKTKEKEEEEIGKVIKKINTFKKRREILSNTLACIKPNENNNISEAAFGGREIYYYNFANNNDRFTIDKEKDIIYISKRMLIGNSNNKGIEFNSIFLKEMANNMNDYFISKKSDPKDEIPLRDLSIIYLSGIYSSGFNSTFKSNIESVSNKKASSTFKNSEKEINNLISTIKDTLDNFVILLETDNEKMKRLNNIFLYDTNVYYNSINNCGIGEKTEALSIIDKSYKELKEDIEKLGFEAFLNDKDWVNITQNKLIIDNFTSSANCARRKEIIEDLRLVTIKKYNTYKNFDNRALSNSISVNVEEPVIYFTSSFFEKYIVSYDTSKDIRWEFFDNFMNDLITIVDNETIIKFNKLKEVFSSSETDNNGHPTLKLKKEDEAYIDGTLNNNYQPIERIENTKKYFQSIYEKFSYSKNNKNIPYNDLSGLSDDEVKKIKDEALEKFKDFLQNNSKEKEDFYSNCVLYYYNDSQMISTYSFFTRYKDGILDLSYDGFNNPNEINEKYNDILIENLNEFIKNYSDIIKKLEKEKHNKIKNDDSINNNEDVIKKYLINDINDTTFSSCMKYKYNDSLYKEDLDIVKKTYSSVVNRDGDYVMQKTSNEIEERLGKIDKDLQEAEDNYQRIKEKFSDDGIICLSLGGEESQANYSDGKKVSNPKYYKSLSSLFNSFTSQCCPYINYGGDYNDSSDVIKYNSVDETGTTISVEKDEVSSSKKLSWSVIGYVNPEKAAPEEKIPIVGFHYLRPFSPKKIRWYSWGTGNPTRHCVKSVNIETSSEFGMLNSAVIKNSSNGETFYINDKGETVKTSDFISKNQFISNMVTSNSDFLSLQNSMINGIKKGTIEILGDPSLRFQGNIMPSSYPIYLDIKLQKSDSWNDNNPNDSIVSNCHLSGYYVINKITHKLSSSGYTTVLDVMSYPSLAKDINNL